MRSVHLLLVAAIAALYVLHQDIWFWRSARPLVLGFLPVGLAYHGAYCIAASVMMWALTRLAWPSHLERVQPSSLSARAARSGSSARAARSGLPSRTRQE
jgi:Protein of unknown function (DUF3311)